MNCLLYLMNYKSRRHFRANGSKQAPNCPAQSKLAISLLFPTQSQQPHASNGLGQNLWESFLNSLSCLTYNSSAIPAYTGLEIHSKSDLFAPFTVTTLAPTTTNSHLDHCNHFQYSLFAYIFALFS